MCDAPTWSGLGRVNVCSLTPASGEVVSGFDL